MSTTDRQEAGCIAPPGISGNEVIAAADGEAAPETLKHLRECPHCAERVERIRTFQRRLRRRLYRVNCPPTQVLVDYCQGLLEPRLYAAIAHHIALCPHCAHEIEWLTDGDVGSEPARYGGYLLASARRPLL